MSAGAANFSPRTEEAYVFWIRRFIPKRHPSEMGKTEVVAFLNHVAGPRQVSTSTQSQASNASLFLYKRVLETDPGWFDGLTRVQRKQSLPVVLSEGEVLRVLSAMSGTPRLVAQLLYGAGSRVMEWGEGFRRRPRHHRGALRQGQQGPGDAAAQILP